MLTTIGWNEHLCADGVGFLVQDQQVLLGMQEEVHAWVHERNSSPVIIDWQFTTSDARINLKKLDPSFHDG